MFIALCQLLDVNLQTVPITAGIDSVIALIEGKGISAPYLTDIVNSWKSLLADMDQRGVLHFERARAFDVHRFVKMRDSQARANFVMSSCSADFPEPEPEPVGGAPNKRTRDGSYQRFVGQT